MKMGHYRTKDTIERAFKQIKGVLDMRPVRLWLRSQNEYHLRV
jgi:transposase